MYPFARLAWKRFAHRNDPALSFMEPHVSHHICWPWDLDFFFELNNGRTLTLYDLGRMTASPRIGLEQLMKSRRLGFAVAGASVRYRKRVRAFDKITMTTRGIGWDDRFFYIEQAMWVRGTCVSHILLRTAVTDHSGIVATADVTEALGLPEERPELPDWVAAWCAAEDLRPWPPEAPP